MRVFSTSPLATQGSASTEADWTTQLNGPSNTYSAPSAPTVTQQFQTQQNIPNLTTASAAELTQQQGGFNGPVTSAALAPTTTVPYVSPTDVPAASVDGLSAPLTATPQEQKASALSDQLQALYNQTVGESAYRTQQEGIYGIEGLTKTQNDLQTQLQGIKNEAAAIPLQLQQGAADRGVTTPVLGRQENSRLRTNAIAALGVSTLLEASRGNLATALAQVDRAVAQKYDPIREQIYALSHNLQLILNDPRTALEDRNRAQAQLDIQNAKLKAVNDAAIKEKEIWNIATTAASNGQNFTATPEYPNLALALQAISAAPTKEVALQIAVAAGLVKGTAGGALPTASIQEYQFAVKNGYTGTFTQYQNEDANRKATATGAIPPSITGAKFTQTDVQQLIAAGFTQAELPQIQADINQYGFAKATEGMNATQKSALQTVLTGKATVTPFITPEFLKTSFGSASIDSMLKALGKSRSDYAHWYQSAATEEANIRADFTKYLTDTLYPLVEQYRQAGYTDKEIMALLQ